MAIGLRIGAGLESIVVVAGLSIALCGVSIVAAPHAAIIRRAFARRYWRPDSLTDAIVLALGLLNCRSTDASISAEARRTGDSLFMARLPS